MTREDMTDQLADRLRDSRPISEGSYDCVNLEERTDSAERPIEPALAVSLAGEWEDQLLRDPKNRLAVAALSQYGNNALTQRATQIRDTQHFNVKISLEGGPITNQRASGRCWLFASTNIFRVAFMRRYNLKDLELSQSYLFFWDKLEKANWCLEQVLDTVQEPLDGRLVQAILHDPVGDGGQWDMAANLVDKYGLVPHHLYPDSYNAQNSRNMNRLITAKLREDALKLRRLSQGTKDARATLGSVKDGMMRDIHRILTIMLGPPPKPDQEFTWEFYDKEDKFNSVTTTPLKYAAELSTQASVFSNNGVNVHEVFSLVNDPRNEYGKLLSVSRLGNIIELRGVRYVNVSMDTMKAACVSMLKADIPIFFGSDVGKFSNTTSGIMDLDLVDYELGFNIKLGMDKAQRLMTGESAMTHAMVLTAVHLDENDKPTRWRVQNSWGETAGTKGYFVMSDRWMDHFVYQVVVDPKFVSQETRDVLKQQPNMLPLWDPMGALA